MKTIYITTEHAEKIDLPSTSCKCSCGESYKLVNEEANEQYVVCDSCWEDAPFMERY